MLRLQIIPFRACHIEEVLPELSKPMIDLAQYAETHGPAYTGCVHGTKLACAGAAIQYPQTAELWAVFSPFIKLKMSKTIFKETRRLLLKAIEDHPEVKCWYAFADKNDLVAQRFIEHLHKGFEVKRFQYELLV